MATRVPPGFSLTQLDEIMPSLVDNGLPGNAEFLACDTTPKDWATEVVVISVWHGFLPMGGAGMLLPKIHDFRCVLKPQDCHVGRKSKRRAKGFELTISEAFDEVVRLIQKHTFTSCPGDCWLTDELAAIWKAANGLKKAKDRGIRFHSVELRHVESGRIVAGEIGYTCGSVYSSCTGFSLKDEFPGLGSVQLVALGAWLHACGFTIWDLGMELDYKRELGGRPVPRAQWAAIIRMHRQDRIPGLASPPPGKASAVTLIQHLKAGEDGKEVDTSAQHASVPAVAQAA
eukprot:TRINITY_DN22905_c0_g1_i2.p1 TRINITY_DN22905_c0_g1~~TRINITY_DN22905_c0_g1_i2.p1  ORF type:complete len:287 (-),score=43.67 TRINITY_DN22905_c0_g1_i2:327-1187(-)